MRSPASKRSIALASAVVWSSACVAGGELSSGVERVDSAGVEIVRSDIDPFSPVTWMLSDAPLLSIGSDPGDELFRATDGTVLSSGSLAIVNGGYHTVRFYDSQGRFLHEIGGEGNGPGELLSPRRIFRLVGDTVAVAELRRVSWFDANGEFVKSAQISLVRPDVALADGSFLGARFAPGEDPYVPGASRPVMSLVRWWPDSGDTATIAVGPGDSFYGMKLGDDAVVTFDLGFGPSMMYDAAGGDVLIADGGTFEIRVLDQQGELRRIYRREIAPLPLTSERTKEYERYLLESVRTENQRSQLNRLFSEWTYPETEPYFDRIVIDSDGFIWLRAYAYDASAERHWSILDPQGRYRGDLVTPPDFAVWEIGGDYVLGTTRGPNGVERVVIYGLSRR